MAKTERIQKRRSLPPCSNYDVERLESWLQDMAADGWMLDGDSAWWFGVFTFKKAEPQSIRYRLDPKPNHTSEYTNAPDDEAESLYREYGWEFVTAYSWFYIYRTADPDARELNTDLAVQAEALKWAKKSFSISMVFELIMVCSWAYRIFKEPYHFLVSLDIVLLVFFVGLLISALVVSVIRAVHIHKLRKQLKASIPLDHNKSWRKGAALHRAGSIASTFLYFLILAMICTSCTSAMNSSYSKIDTADYPGDPPFVTISDMCPEGSFTPKPFISGYNKYTIQSTDLAPVIIEWEEYGELVTPDGRIMEGSLIVSYYETASPALARGLAEDFLRTAQGRDDYTQLDAPELAVDYVAAYHFIYPTVIIQHGNIVIEARVPLHYGDEQYLMEQWAVLMAALLTQ